MGANENSSSLHMWIRHNINSSMIFCISVWVLDSCLNKGRIPPMRKQIIELKKRLLLRFCPLFLYVMIWFWFTAFLKQMMKYYTVPLEVLYYMLKILTFIGPNIIVVQLIWVLLEMDLERLPSLVFQLGHLISNPTRNIWYGHMNDILEKNGKVLQRQKLLFTSCNIKGYRDILTAWVLAKKSFFFKIPQE